VLHNLAADYFVTVEEGNPAAKAVRYAQRHAK
jgi:hypothetical protein